MPAPPAAEIPPARFPSKRDAWIVALIWGAVALLLGAAVSLARETGASAGTWIAGTVGPLVAGFMLWVTYGTHYTVGDRWLVIRSGPFRWRVPLDRVTAVRATHNPLSSPAVSLDRLRIETGRRWILVSPEDKAGFVALLRARCPQLGRVEV